MPWLLSLTEGAFKALGGHIASQGIQLFQDYARPWIMGLVNTYAERYLSLTSEQLCSFYSEEKPLRFPFGGKVYQLPMSMLIPPTRFKTSDNERIKITLIPNKYEKSSRISIYTTPLLERLATGTDSRLFDGEVVRLHSIDHLPDDSWNMSVAQASYFDALATNFAMDYSPPGLNQSLREFLSGQTRQLGNLSESPLVNHIGVICMIETADGMLVVQKRSAKVANRPTSMSASVSGALNWADINNGRLTIDDIANGALRESFEELGVHLPQNLLFLGLIREYLRGGKPEFYFFAKCDHSYDEIANRRKTAQDRSETNEIVPYAFNSDQIISNDRNSQFAFVERVKNILEGTGKEANLTLATGVCLAADRLLTLKSDRET